MKKLLHMFTAGDIILALFFLILAASLLIWTTKNPGEAGGSAVISRNGEMIAEYPLDKDARIPLEWQGHYNLLVIENGRAYVQEANCPDGYCLRQGPISRERETIVCLPARLVVSVSGGNTEPEEGELDALSR